MFKHYFRYARLATAALCAAACGDQASTGYRGEPLLTFTGSVQLLEGSDDEPSVPTIAFEGPGGRWSIMDADVEGMFPARFTLRVFEPPPDDALADYSDLFGDDHPAVAFGHLTASPPGYASTFQNANSRLITTGCDIGVDDCTRVLTELCEVTEEHAESHDGFDPSYCWVEIRECDFVIDWDLDQDFSGCPIVETYGNPEAGDRPTEHFAGYAHTHAVLYLDAPAPKNSFIAWMFNQLDGIPQGYHIVEPRLRSAAEVEEAQLCNDAAQDLGAERYVAKHPELGCTYLPGDENSGGFYDCEDEGMVAKLKPGADVLAAALELGCPPFGDATSHLVDTATTELEIEIGPELQDFGFGSQRD